MKLSMSSLTIVIGALALTTPGLVTSTQAQTTIRASVATNGVQGNGDSTNGDLSDDGRFAVFISSATNLVSPATSGPQIFVRDLVNKTTSLVSVSTDGIAGNGECFKPRISSDGRFVSFTSWADNLVPEDTNLTRDIFVRDLAASPPTTTRVSVANDGTQANGDCDHSAISADGQVIAFQSRATNLGGGGTYSQVYVRNLAAGTTSLVSVGAGGFPGNGDSGLFVQSISTDGRYVGFSSAATNLVGGDMNGFLDVFVRDLQTESTTLVSVSSTGVQGNGDSYTSVLTGNGRVVAFTSNATNLVGGDTNKVMDVFVRYLDGGTTIRVSVSSTNVQGNGTSGSGLGGGTDISEDGRYVAFQSFASKLVSGDSNNDWDVFVRDLQTGKTTMASVTITGKPGSNNSSGGPRLSKYGAYIQFRSWASNLVTGDTNGVQDSFVRGPAR